MNKFLRLLEKLDSTSSFPKTKDPKCKRLIRIQIGIFGEFCQKFGINKKFVILKQIFRYMKIPKHCHEGVFRINNENKYYFYIRRNF